MRRRVRRSGNERGQAAGIESIPFGILVFIGGMIMVVSCWAVVDTRTALDTAARDYLRAYTSAPDGETARARGQAAARRSIESRSWSDRLVVVDPFGAFGPCRPATVTLEVEVPALWAPFIGSLGSTVVRTTQTELVQPFGVARDEAGAGRPTPCDG